MTIKCNNCAKLQAEIRRLEKAVSFWEEQEFQLGIKLGIYNKAKVSWNTLDETMHWSGFGGMQAGPEPTCEHGHSEYAMSQGEFCSDCEQ